MPLYRYRAKDPDARTLSGTLEVESERSLINLLRERGLVIVSLTEERHRPQLWKSRPGRVKEDDLIVFSRQLATMVNAGLPLVQSLHVLNEQMENRAFKKVLQEIERDIEGGANLSDALVKHPKLFSELFVNLVKAGEASGMLDEILDRIASYLEASGALRRKVRAALIYPAVVTGISLLITAFLLIWVIPKFKDIFAGFGAKLPLPTALLLALSDNMRAWFLPFLAFSVILGVILRLYVRSDRGRLWFDQLKLNLPVFGVLLKKVAISKFARTFCTLVKSGVPILTSLQIVGRTAGNKVIEQAVDGTRVSIREGESVAEPLGKSPVFPPMVVRMIAVGEQTGALEKMLAKIADFYDQQVEAAVSGLTSMIEPLLIAFLGVVIGSIVICMFLPIFKLSSVIGM